MEILLDPVKAEGFGAFGVGYIWDNPAYVGWDIAGERGGPSEAEDILGRGTTGRGTNVASTAGDSRSPPQTVNWCRLPGWLSFLAMGDGGWGMGGLFLDALPKVTPKPSGFPHGKSWDPQLLQGEAEATRRVLR